MFDLESALAIILKKKRKELGISQEELAYRCNVDRTYVSMLERKKRKPTLSIVFKICETFGISTSDFIKEIESVMKENNNT